MLSTNGHSPKKRAILYARVSTEEQVRSGYSLAQQLEALREYAAREGYEILEEVTDPGQSGASLARPGLDRVRDLVAAGGVSAVLAQDRDRFAREPAYHYLLKKEFEEHSTKLRSLNDRGDDSPEGQLTDDGLDVMAKFERAKTAERTRRGKIRKVRVGKLLRSPQPPFGFRYNVAGDGLVIHEPEMHVVEKIFCLAVEGLGTRAMQSRLPSVGMPTAKGEPVWSDTSLKRIVTSDVYMPHTYDEMVKLVTTMVAERLDPDKQYGIRWHNRHKARERIVSEPDGNGGRRYTKRVSRTLRPQDEWVAVPVPAYLPRSLIERARAALANNKGVDRKHLAREWELRGLTRCSCGATMETHTVQPHSQLYHYYSCRRRRRLRKMCDCKQPSIQAHKVEPVVWKFVSGLLKDPEHIKHGMEGLIALERRGRRETLSERRERGRRSWSRWTTSARATRRWRQKASPLSTS